MPSLTPLMSDSLIHEDCNLKRKRSKSPDTVDGQKLIRLELEIPMPSRTDPEEHSANSYSSLFSSSEHSILNDLDITRPDSIPEGNCRPALRIAPPIPGLLFEPTLIIPQEIADSVFSFCMKTYFHGSSNQVMLFGRFQPSSESLTTSNASGLPGVLLRLLYHLSEMLKGTVPPDIYVLLFPSKPSMARQAIINLYSPGDGITPHVDLLKRYGDGIIGVSLNSGCVMRFDKLQKATSEDERDTRWDVYLPERSVIVLTKEARYDWTHGIEETTRDSVMNSSHMPDDACVPPTSFSQPDWTWHERGIRVSVTFRWLLPGADVVGDDTA